MFNQDVQTFSSPLRPSMPYFLCACLIWYAYLPVVCTFLTGGAALGRLVGHLLHRLDAQSGTFADAGTYAPYAQAWGHAG